MVYVFITLVIVISVASYILLVLKIRESNAIYISEKAEVIRTVEKVNFVASKVFDTAQLIVDHQNALDKKMNALSSFMNKRNNYMTLQLEQFERLAKSDMLAARRDELILAKELKVALDRLMSSALVSRQPPASNDVFALENITRRIEELGGVINDMMN